MFKTKVKNNYVGILDHKFRKGMVEFLTKAKERRFDMIKVELLKDKPSLFQIAYLSSCQGGNWYYFSHKKYFLNGINSIDVFEEAKKSDIWYITEIHGYDI